MARGQMSKMAAKSGPKDGSIADLTPKQLKQQASMMRKSTPNALRRRFPQMKNMTDNEIMQQISYMEQLANDEDLREQAKQTFAKSGNELRELQQLSKKNPDQMTAQELHKMMTIQRDLLRDNPETFWQQAANNPQLKDMSREEVEKQINQVADMDPEELQQYMSMQKTIGPLMQFMQKMQLQTNGYARYVVLCIAAMFVYYLIRKIFRLP